MDLSLILLNTSCRIYSVPKEKKYRAAFLSKNNEIQCFTLLCLSLRFMTHALYSLYASFILGKNTMKHRLVIEIPCNLDIA